MFAAALSGFVFNLLHILSLYTPPHDNIIRLELRHIHGTAPDTGRIVFADYRPEKWIDLTGTAGQSYSIKTRKIRTYRPQSIGAFNDARAWSMRFGQSVTLPWDEDDVLGPDIESREVLLALAKMSSNAYLQPNETGWYELGANWTSTYPFGWEPDADGFRGQVFATPDNQTVVLSIKGTSAAFIGGGGPTAKKDKINDNLLFSCCCAHVDWTWTTVCGCHRGGWKCDQDCLEESLIEDSLFYPIGVNLYNNLTYMYPESNIWVIGHSLGGSLASLVGTTFGAPVVAFEAPGERMAAERLHLPSPPSTQHVTHIYHTADPIAMGTCNGVLSSCSIGGYAMESKCHLGKSIVYDTVSNLSWSVDIRTHPIATVIEKLLSEPWQPSLEAGREVPEPRHEEDCVECYSWDFGNYT
ncbi:alpha/beta-hydrolase [Cylindrobasidium torrendii FP15055 ss-10]|uniref:triacylglycerol lipase n=1 Tax=Cylindrobasidium torrendii FP15055 ss-10 TaxID=1314674 RepID=A0A0D7B2I6_9AGAR|nr:alpha/beta-hydrolase [Cylindrobasidium torrendii FP15055 ss-10]